MPRVSPWPAGARRPGRRPPPRAGRAGGVRRPVPLHPPADGQGRWTFDAEQLRAAVTPRTKLLLVNTPHNPTGKVFTREELATLAAIAISSDLLVLTDEVYEHLV